MATTKYSTKTLYPDIICLIGNCDDSNAFKCNVVSFFRPNSMPMWVLPTTQTAFQIYPASFLHHFDVADITPMLIRFGMLSGYACCDCLFLIVSIYFIIKYYVSMTSTVLLFYV